MALVVSVLASIAMGAAVGAGPRCVTPKRQQARAELATLDLAAEMHDVALDGCPTIDTLVNDGALTAETTRIDPWRNPYEIICDTSGPRARSAGPDAVFGTRDDL